MPDNTLERLAEFKKHVEDSVLVIVRGEACGSKTYAQLDRLTRQTCELVGFNFDEIYQRAASLVILERAGLVEVSDV